VSPFYSPDERRRARIDNRLDIFYATGTMDRISPRGSVPRAAAIRPAGHHEHPDQSRFPYFRPASEVPHIVHNDA